MLETLGNLGDFVGGVAVIVTLIYLAQQVRQNTRALQTASRQAVTAGFRDYNRLSFQPGATRAVAEGMRRYPEMEEPAKGLFGSMVNDHALFIQSAHALYEAGTLEEETYQAYLRYFAAFLATPGGRAWWQEISPLYTPRMVEAVNARLEEGGLPDLLALTAFEERPEAPGGPGERLPGPLAPG
jgi:hypothetical protein